MVLTEFEGKDRQYHTHQCHDPKPHRYLTLMITQLLVVMVKGTHQKYPSALTIFPFCVFEITHLNHYTQTLHKEDQTEYGDQ